MNSNNQDGFTLIEFCVAVLIMMVGLLGLLQAVNMANMHNLGTILRNEAVTLADDRMMRAKTKITDAASFSGLVSDSSSTTNLTNDVAVTNTLVSRNVRAGFANYSVVLTVATAGTNTKEISSRVVWRHKGNKQSHTISSVVANPN